MTTPATPGLCPSCRFVRSVRGRRGQLYLLCRNDAVPEKYPRQPVLACAGFEPAKEQRAGSPEREGP